MKQARAAVACGDWRDPEIGLVISDKDIGDGGDTEAGVAGGEAEQSLHQLQDSEQVTIRETLETLGHLQTRDGGQGHGCRDEASQV